MTDLNGNTVPIPSGATQQPLPPQITPQQALSRPDLVAPPPVQRPAFMGGPVSKSAPLSPSNASPLITSAPAPLPPASDTALDMLKNTAKTVAKVSAPNILYAKIRQHFPQANLPASPFGNPDINDIMQTGLPMLIPGAEMPEEQPTQLNPRVQATQPENIPNTAENAPGLLEHPGVAPLWKYLKNEIPGAKIGKAVLSSARGFIEGAPEAPVPPAPPAPAPPAPRLLFPSAEEDSVQLRPQTNGIPWGTQGGPLSTRGQYIAAPPAPAAPPEVTAPAPTATPKAVQSQLNSALGNKPLVPGVSLRNQPAAQAAAQAAELPQGFTPVESSALKGYKYSPSTREFETVMPNGQRLVYGDVRPSEVEAFENAPSKGNAFGRMKGTLVAKVVNGQRVNLRPTGMLDRIKSAGK